MADLGRYRKPARNVLAGLFIAAGAMHFAVPSVYEKIMPPYLPWHRTLIYLSGAAEVAGGAGLLVTPTRRWAGYGLVALLFAVYPANIHMASEAVQQRGWTAPYTLATLARLPLQFPLMAWAWWASSGEEEREKG